MGDDMSANDDHPELRPKSSTSRHESLQGNELIMFCLGPGKGLIMFCLNPDQLTEKILRGPQELWLVIMMLSVYDLPLFYRKKFDWTFQRVFK